MQKLTIEIQTPTNFCDIDFTKMADHFGKPIEAIMDLEGTALSWGYLPRHAEVGSDVQETIASANGEGALSGAHAITNRAGAGGRALTELFSRTVRTVAPTLPTFGEYPLSRAERKPSGVMSRRLVDTIHAGYAGAVSRPGEKRTASGLIVAFVGDKLSDMLEAEALHQMTGTPVIGFMVKRYGDTDHPFDKLFGKRRQASAARLDLQVTAHNRFVQ